MSDAESRALVHQITDNLQHVLDLLYTLKLRTGELPSPLLTAGPKVYDLLRLFHREFRNAPSDPDQALDQLLAAHPTWNHPAPVLGRPRPSLASLLAACDERLATAQGDDHRRLSEVKEKLENTARLDERARRRRLGELDCQQ